MYTHFPLSCDCRSSPPKTFFLFFGNSNSYYDFHLGSKSRVAVGASADQVIFRPLEIETGLYENWSNLSEIEIGFAWMEATMCIDFRQWRLDTIKEVSASSSAVSFSVRSISISSRRSCFQAWCSENINVKACSYLYETSKIGGSHSSGCHFQRNIFHRGHLIFDTKDF